MHTIHIYLQLAQERAGLAWDGYMRAVPAPLPLDTHCPTCGAKPGHSCRWYKTHTRRVRLVVKAEMARHEGAKQAAEAAHALVMYASMGRPREDAYRHVASIRREPFMISQGWVLDDYWSRRGVPLWHRGVLADAGPFESAYRIAVDEFMIGVPEVQFIDEVA